MTFYEFINLGKKTLPVARVLETAMISISACQNPSGKSADIAVSVTFAQNYGAMRMKPNRPLGVLLHDKYGTTLNLFVLWLNYLSSVIPRAIIR